MEIIKGKKTYKLNLIDFEKIIKEYSEIEIDIGTGDGKFVYEFAKKNQNKFFLGIDADRNQLEKYSHKIFKKKEKGGLKNVLYLISNAETLPYEINNIANNVWIILPWGSLLRGIILGEKKLLNNIYNTAKNNCIVKIFITYDLKYEPQEIEKQGLPNLTLDYISNELKINYERENIFFLDCKILKNDYMKEIPSFWSRKLGFGRERSLFYIEAMVKK